MNRLDGPIPIKPVHALFSYLPINIIRSKGAMSRLIRSDCQCRKIKAERR